MAPLATLLDPIAACCLDGRPCWFMRELAPTEFNPEGWSDVNTNRTLKMDILRVQKCIIYRLYFIILLLFIPVIKEVFEGCRARLRCVGGGLHSQ